MSRSRLGVRLAVRDLRRRGTETALLFVALAVASTTLTIGLVLHGQTATPYAVTRDRTAGPDVTAALFPAPGRTVTAADLAGLRAVASRPAVTARSRAFPMAWTAIHAHGLTGVAEVQGRDSARGPVDRPQVVSGQWVGRHGVVLERAFADAMHLRVGDAVLLGGHPQRVIGIAVSAALPPYPQLCTIGCILDRADWFSAQPGLVWASRDEVASLASRNEPLVWFEYLELQEPAVAPQFAAAAADGGPPDGRPELTAWQDIAGRQAEQLANERAAVVFGSSLLVILALATLVVLVGGRMSDEAPRMGMLKAAGATPGYIVCLLLASYLAVGLVAALTGIVAGRLLAPRLVTLSAGLLGHVGVTRVSVPDAALVVGCVLTIVVVACSLPAWRSARRSTVQALGASPTVRRNRHLVAVSNTMPTPLLLGLQLAGRRPRRALLTGISVAVAVCGTIVVLYAQASLNAERGDTSGPADPLVAQLHTVTTTLTILLAVMAGVNLVFVTRASAVDARRVLALARTLGVTPSQAATALGVAQLIPALSGLILGWITGALLFHSLAASHPVAPPTIQLVALAVLTVATTVALTAGPAGLEARRPLAGTLREL